MDIGEITKYITRGVWLNPYEVGHPAQLAIRKLGTTALRHGDIKGTSDAVTSLSVGTNKAGVRVIGQDFGQALLAPGYNLRRGALDLDPFFGMGRAGRYKLTIELNETQSAALELQGFGAAAPQNLPITPDSRKADLPPCQRETGVRAKAGDVDARAAGRLKEGHT